MGESTSSGKFAVADEVEHSACDEERMSLISSSNLARGDAINSVRYFQNMRGVKPFFKNSLIAHLNLLHRYTMLQSS